MLRAVCFGLMVCLLTGSTGSALQAQPADDVFQDSWQHPSAPQLSGTTQCGFVFLNGSYIPAPYRLEATLDRLLVNGVPVPGLLPEGESGPIPSPAEQLLTRVLCELEHQGILVAFAHQTPFLVPMGSPPYCELIKFFSRDGHGQEQLDIILPWLPKCCDRNLWQDHLLSMRISLEGRQRLQRGYDLHLQLIARNRAEVRANRTLYHLSYPLTALGTLVCVFAVGHLLLYRPDVSQNPHEINANPQQLKLVSISLGLIGVMSTFDLLWTLLAWQAGQMQELNPLGHQLVDHPLFLILFKGAATLTAIGVLYAVRMYPRGQLATWWACLILTLVTIRWVAFNTMFVN